MDTGLVVLASTERGVELLREAAEHASGADAELVLLSTFSRDQADHDLEVLNRIETAEGADLGELMGAELGEDVGHRIADRVLAEYDVEYTVVGAVTGRRIGRRILEAADSHDCDHVFLLSKRRSRVDGTLGEAARRVVRRFDGFTTVGRERDPDRRIARLRGTADSYEIEVSY